MKTAVILFGLFFVGAAVDMSVPLLKVVNKGYVECASYLSPDQLSSDLCAHNIGPHHRGANCMRACLLDAIGFTNKTGLNIPYIMEVVSKVNPNDNLELWTYALTFCKRNSERLANDRCDVAGNYLKCYQQIAKKPKKQVVITGQKRGITGNLGNVVALATAGIIPSEAVV